MGRRCAQLGQPFGRDLPWVSPRWFTCDAKEHPVTVRRLILAVGVTLLIAGIIALLVPVSVSDGNGGSVGCGNAVAEDLSGARSANSTTVANVPILNQIVPHADFVAQCQSAVSSRRAW
jgi:hypothetical protein